MYDYHVSGEIEKLVPFAIEFGWKGFCYVLPYDDFENRSRSLKRIKSIDVSLGVLIEAETMNDIRKMVDKIRDKAELVFVRGGDVELNRYIFNMPKIDVVTNVANESQLDYVMCRLAEKHNIAIEFSFLDLLQSYSKTRSRLLANYIKNANIVRKYNTRFMITSGALSKWDLRSPHDLGIFAKMLGFQDPEIKAAMSPELLDENKKRLSGKRIMRDVEEI